LAAEFAEYTGQMTSEGGEGGSGDDEMIAKKVITFHRTMTKKVVRFLREKTG